MFEAVILVGGFGTRLKSVSGNIPKPMVQVGGRPFLNLLLEKLEKAGCKRIILSLHYQADLIKHQISHDKPVSCEIIYVIEETPLGTGGAIKLASKSVIGQSFLALNGDTYSDINYAEFYKNSIGHELVLSGVKVDNAKRYGKLIFDSNYNLISMTEKGSCEKGIINSGTYLIAKSSVSIIAESKFSFEESLIPRFYNTAKVFVFEGKFIDIGIPKDYELACRTLA